MVQGCHICSGWSSCSGCFPAVLVKFGFDLEINLQVYLLDFGLVATVPNTPEHFKHILPQFCSCMPAQVYMILLIEVELDIIKSVHCFVLMDWILDQPSCIRP